MEEVKVKIVDIHQILYNNSGSEASSDEEEEETLPERIIKSEPVDEDSCDETGMPELAPDSPGTTEQIVKTDPLDEDEDEPRKPLRNRKGIPPKVEPGVKRTFTCNIMDNRKLAQFDEFFSYQCDQCRDQNGFSLPIPGYVEMKDHLTTVHKTRRPPYAYCCGTRIASKKFFTHARLNHAPEEGDINCPECDLICDNKAALAEHKAEDHKPTEFLCSECDQKFATILELRKHREVCNKDTAPCPVCGKDILIKHLERHQRTHTSGQFECLLCNKSFRTQLMLTQHEAKHTSKHEAKLTSEHKATLKLKVIEKLDYDEYFTYHCESCPEVDGKPKVLSNYKEMKAHFKSEHQKKGYAFCCGVKFFYDRMRGHLLRHLHPDKEFKCDQCYKSFDSEIALKMHIYNTKNSTRHSTSTERQDNKDEAKPKETREKRKKPDYDKYFTYHCESCLESDGSPKVLSNYKEMKAHFKSEHKKKGYAFCCGEKFFYERMRGHLFRHLHPEKEFKCDQCNKSFESEVNLKRHLSNKRKAVTTTRGQEKRATKCGNSSMLPLSEYDKFFQYSCHFCPEVDGSPKVLSDYEEMTTHFKSQHNTRGYAFCCTEKIPWTHMRGHLLRHLHPEKEFKCDQCKKSFDSKSLLRKHISQKGKSQKKRDAVKASCLQCNVEFSSTHDYRKHLITSPAHNPTIICELCGKTMKEKSLKAHMAGRHFPEKTPCPGCGKVFSNASSTYQHYQMHHKRRGEIFSCKFCDFKSRHKSTVYWHNNHTHGRNADGTPYVAPLISCAVCEKNFSTKHGLKDHMMVHTGERKYSCEFCEETFTASSNFYMHRRMKHPVEYAEWKAEGKGVVE